MPIAGWVDRPPGQHQPSGQPGRQSLGTFPCAGPGPTEEAALPMPVALTPIHRWHDKAPDPPGGPEIADVSIVYQPANA